MQEGSIEVPQPVIELPSVVPEEVQANDTEEAPQEDQEPAKEEQDEDSDEEPVAEEEEEVKPVQPNCDKNNLLTNGCFERPNVAKWKIFKEGQVEGWSGNGIEIGKAKFYNPNWPRKDLNQVVEMDGRKNIELSQTVTLTEGTYDLSLECAARKGKDLGTSQLEILWNGKVVETVSPQDYKIQRVNLQLQGTEGENTLTLRGAGKSDGLGISVDAVKLRAGTKIPSTSIPD